PLQTRKRSIARATFLYLSSNVNAHYQYNEIGDNDAHQYGVGAEYFVPNSDYYLSGNVNRHDLQDNNNVDNDLTTYCAEVGYLPAPGLLIAAGVKGWDNDRDDGVDPTLRA